MARRDRSRRTTAGVGGNAAISNDHLSPLRKRSSISADDISFARARALRSRSEEGDRGGGVARGAVVHVIIMDHCRLSSFIPPFHLRSFVVSRCEYLAVRRRQEETTSAKRIGDSGFGEKKRTARRRRKNSQTNLNDGGGNPSRVRIDLYKKRRRRRRERRSGEGGMRE